MSPTSGGALARIRELEKAVDRLEANREEDARQIALLTEQLTGERGISAAIRELAQQVAGIRRAAWWVGGIIVTASIGFAFGVLALIPA